MAKQVRNNSKVPVKTSGKVDYNDPYNKEGMKRLKNNMKSIDSGRVVIHKQFDSSKMKDGSYPMKAVNKFKKSIDSIGKEEDKAFATYAKRKMAPISYLAKLPAELNKKSVSSQKKTNKNNMAKQNPLMKTATAPIKKAMAMTMAKSSAPVKKAAVVVKKKNDGVSAAATKTLRAFANSKRPLTAAQEMKVTDPRKSKK